MLTRKDLAFHLVILLILLMTTVNAFALGRISGKVIDKETGEALPVVNIVVKGTYLGATTDLEGNYTIVGLKPGSYDIQATYIGYKIAINTNVVINSPDAAVTIDFAMEPTVLAIGQEVVLIGEKPLLDVDETASVRSLNSEDIGNIVAEDVNDLLETQVGVTRENNEIHIRGGRADENLYIIDNLSVKDPISGQGLGIYLSADAIKNLEVITGGFNAEYGEAMSGLVNVETREGGEDFHGSLRAKTDNVVGFPSGHQNTGNTEFSLSGPFPINDIPGLHIIPGEFGFFVNGYGYISDTHLPNASGDLIPFKSQYEDFAIREENNWSLLSKVNWKPSLTTKFSYSYGRSLQINQGYFDALVEDKRYFPLEFMNILRNYNTVTREGIQQNWNWSHTLNKRSYYELTIGNFYNRVHSGVGGLHWTEYTEPIDVEPVRYYTLANGEIVVDAGDGLWDGGTSDVYHDHFNTTWQAKGKFTSQVHEKHQVRAGFEYEDTKLQLLHINDPWVSSTDLGGDYDMYHATTQAGAFYVQDKIEFEGMIANVGVRLDWWAPGQYVEDAINDTNVITLTDAARELFYDETDEVLGRRIKFHISPRLGISHPVTDSDVLFFSYGHFSQRPKYAYVYAKLKSYSPSTYQLFGNPNLNPQTTVAYELGIKHRFSGDEVLELTAFYKDIFDYPTSFQVNSENPRLGNISYYQYFNIDYARVRGIEMRFRARRGRFWTGTADFSYQIATGKSSSANAEIQAAADTRVAEKTLGEEYLAWDRPFQMHYTLWLNVRKGDRPDWFGVRWPDRWGGSLRWDISTGKRYTPQEFMDDGHNVQDSGEKYSAIADWWNTMDLKLWKEFALRGDMTLRTFIELENIFDYRVPNQINPLTGEPWNPGDKYPPSWENEQGYVIADPSRYKAGRQMFLGFALQF